jgi:hypothetical protein
MGRLNLYSLDRLVLVVGEPDRVCQSVVILGTWRTVCYMSESGTVVRATNVRCSTCRHIQWVPVDKTEFACERCDAQLTRR